MTITYHGQLRGVVLASGRYRRLAHLELGSVPGRGLVVADTVADLLAGRFRAQAAGRFERITAIFYFRRRAGYAATMWRHDVTSTLVGGTTSAPSFRWSGQGIAARVCARPPGNFICDG